MRLHIAAKAGDLKEAKSALQDGADPNAPDLQGLTPLHHAAIRGAVAVSHLLISSRASVNCVGSGEMSPLHFATLAVHNSSVCHLLAHGADPFGLMVDQVPSLNELLQTGGKMLQKDVWPIELLLQEVAKDGEAAAKTLWEQAEVLYQGKDLQVLDKIADPSSQLLGSLSNASTTTPPTPNCATAFEESQHSLSEVSVGSSNILLSPPCSTKNGGGHVIVLSPASTKTDT
jgi:ankyrin repeat protein